MKNIFLRGSAVRKTDTICATAITNKPIRPQPVRGKQPTSLSLSPIGTSSSAMDTLTAPELLLPKATRLLMR